MTQYPWERAPFFSNPGILIKGLETELPFSIGAISRLGSSHRKHGMNNQDAIHIDISEQCIIGILCDGTSSTDAQLERVFSNNEVGSNVLSLVIGRMCHDLIPKWRGPYSKAFFQHLDRQFKSRYKQLISVLSSGVDESIIAAHFATATCIGFIILKEEYLVFGAGDGFIVHNGTNTPLKNRPFITLANIEKKAPVLHVLTKGKTNELKHLALLSDGFALNSIMEDPALLRFLKKSETVSGFLDISAEFHLEVLNRTLKKLIDQWPKDDASCIVLRRVKTRKNDSSHQ